MAVTILSVIHVIAALILISIILVQTGKSAGLGGAIGGGTTDTFMSKNKNRTRDARLAKATKWVAIGFTLITLSINLMI